VKTNAKGIKQWDADFGGSEFDFLYAVQQTADGGYILGGYSSSNTSGDKTQDTKGLNDYWIVKTSADGVSCNIPINLKTTKISSEGATLKWDSVPGVINYFVEYRIAGSLSDWTIINASNNHKQLRGLFAGTQYEWRVRSVCSSQKIVLSGWSVKQFFTTSSLSVATVEKTVLHSQNSFGEVYPNPVSQSATVSFSLIKASHMIITIMDVHGRSLKMIANKDFSQGVHQITFNRESLMGGIYFLQIKTNHDVMTKKILIE
jgi:hypothetical protein